MAMSLKLLEEAKDLLGNIQVNGGEEIDEVEVPVDDLFLD
jgi:hypothetical protein